MSIEKTYEEEVKSMSNEKLNEEFGKWSASTGTRTLNSYSNIMLSIVVDELNRRDIKGNEENNNVILENCANNNRETDVFVLDFSPKLNKYKIRKYKIYKNKSARFLV